MCDTRGMHGSSSSPVPPDPATTRLIQAAGGGDARAVDELIKVVYDQLRAIAQRQISMEKPGNTLQATALVHEAYLRLLGLHSIDWKSRGHFYAAAAEAMRRVLIDHARMKGAKKRGGDWARAVANVCDLAADDRLGEFLSLDDAIAGLQNEDERAATVVRLRFYAGLTLEQTAEALGVSRSSVDRDWAFARAWLMRTLEEEHGGTSAG